MSPSARGRVRKRAGNRCEYCHLLQEDSPLAPLHIDHIIPKVHGAETIWIIWPLPAYIVIRTKAQILRESILKLAGPQLFFTRANIHGKTILHGSAFPFSAKPLSAGPPLEC